MTTPHRNATEAFTAIDPAADHAGGLIRAQRKGTEQHRAEIARMTAFRSGGTGRPRPEGQSAETDGESRH